VDGVQELARPPLPQAGLTAPRPAAEDAWLCDSLDRAGHVANGALAAPLWLAVEPEPPLLREGDAGVGSTALALARARGRRTIGVTEKV
jgi:hypothetical protein